ncbi:MAG: xanthine dehydrogenase family protein molybdopterin-binding subunit [Ignavibacteria bacterium]|nr:xanthine dehydrogenase family protein molybdopterin-binding subunit [Ignavibacteria bacterium]
MKKQKTNTIFNIVGKPVIRQDGYAKVTGKAKYADDYRFDEELYGVMVRTNSSHAIINRIDFSPIENHPVIHSIITHKDITGNKKV